MMSALAWGLVACVGVLWPSRLVGPLDGVPLDTRAEAILVGVVLPFAWILYPRVFRAPTPRVLASALAAWKLGTWLLLSQQGLCATFGVASDSNQAVLRRSWDFRTPVADGLPACSTVLTRSLSTREEFPAWFLNLPIGVDRDLDTGQPRALNLPTSPRVQLHAMGYDAAGNAIERDAVLADNEWHFDLPESRGAFAPLPLTINPPTRLDLLARWFWPIAALLTLALIGDVARRAIVCLRLSPQLAAAVVVLLGVSVVLGLAGGIYARATALLLPAVLLLPVPRRLQNARSVVLFLGVPLFGMLAASSLPQIGRFTIYSAGDDWQTFQRFAARIYFEGFWLEGGERTFWQQPLYRWIAGLLHVLFGDSSVGELYWDGFGLIAAATLAYALVKPCGSHRWAMSAAVATIATTFLAPTWYLVGRGLAEITATMWLSLAAFALLRARRGRTRFAALGGVFATLAFYTRLNHLFIVMALAVLLLPGVSAITWTGRRPALDSRRVRALLLYGGVVATGIVLFAARTWYYTGHFSVLYGTTRQFNSTGLGLATITSAAVWRQVLDSVLMVVTVNDPPRLDPRTVLVVCGVGAAIARLLQAPPLRTTPIAPAVLCVAAISSAFIARGMAYPGRFSVHLIPLAVAVSVIVAARVAGQVRTTAV